ncbi:MAG: aminotransferase class IV [Gammaproteobacteria bacterium]|nr:aminotransferase class IV [Gammaproteobacteria bacterium]
MTGFGDGCAYIDGEYVPVGEARIPILDWGFLHSDATYDVAHVWEGQFFRLDDHVDRFFASLASLRLDPGFNAERIKAILSECVRRSGLRAAYVEMGCTRGLPQPGSRDPRSCKNRFFAFAVPFIWIADPEKQADGLKLTISGRRRIPADSVDPRVKNYHWLDLVMALFDAYDAGGETAVVVDADGNLIEGPGFNIFLVEGDRISTPGQGVLHGITRRTVIEIATRGGFDVKLSDIPAARARLADEVFLSSTGGGVIPVTEVDGKPVGSGKPGPVTGRLQQAYWALHEDPAYTTPIDY